MSSEDCSEQVEFKTEPNVPPTPANVSPISSPADNHKTPPRRDDLNVWLTHGKYSPIFLADTTLSRHTKRDASHNYSPFELNHLKIVARAPDGDCLAAVLDTCSGATLISSSVLERHYPQLVRTPLEKAIPLSGVGTGPTITHRVQLPVNIPDTDKQSWTASEPAYIVDDLSCGLLLGLPFLKAHQLHVEWGPNGSNDIIKIASTGRKIWATCSRDPLTNRKTALIKAAKTITIPPGHGHNVPVNFRTLPVSADGYLIKPYSVSDPQGLTYASLIHGITDGQTHLFPFSNFGDSPITIHRGQQLGTLERLSIAPDLQTFITQKDERLTAVPLSDVLGEIPPEEEEGRHPDGYPFSMPTPEPDFDVDQADIHDGWGPENVERIRNLILQHARLFSPRLGRFNDGVDMPIPFKPDANLDDLPQRPYNMSPRDRAAFDSILKPLEEAGVVESVPLGEICPSSSPAFIVWRNDKPRLVVNLRRVNTKLILHSYPLPRQDDILGSFGGCSVFTIMDITKGFFQQSIAYRDRWKTTFVTPHRGLQRLTVSTMGLATSPGFFQHRMEQLFGPYLWAFVLVYIDDIIVFSRSIDDHLLHLETVFTILENSGCTMSLGKCHFAQAGLEALGHFVSRFGLSTTEEKTEAIRHLEMPKTLQQLEMGLGLMGYYRDFVPDFAIIADPLNELKTIGFKGSPRANPQRDTHSRHYGFPPRLPALGKDVKPEQAESWKKKQDHLDGLWKRCVRAWETLKTALINAVDLAFPDFTKPFILYVDTSARGIGASLHQVQDDGKSRPVLFLSRTLNSAEKNYYATELETLGLVWALDKCSHYLDHSRIKVITDHTAIRDAFSPSARLPRNSRRLTKWQLFLAKYSDRIDIIHRPGKSHVNADALSRLPKSVDVNAPREPLKNIVEPVMRSYVVTRQ